MFVARSCIFGIAPAWFVTPKIENPPGPALDTCGRWVQTPSLTPAILLNILSPHSPIWAHLGATIQPAFLPHSSVNLRPRASKFRESRGDRSVTTALARP